MTATHTSGPDIIYGVPYDANSNSNGTNPEAGPSVTYQGDAILDVRFPYQPGVSGPGRVPAWLDSPYIVMVDALPAAAAAAAIAAAQGATSGTGLALASAAAAGISPAVPVLPFGSSSTSGVVPALGLDMGLATVATTAGSPVVTLSTLNNTVQPNQNMFVQQGTTWVPATVGSVAANGVTVTLSAPMTVTSGSALVISGNNSGQRGAAPTCFTPYLLSGAALLFDPTQAACRGVSVTSNNGADVGWSVKVSGYDLYGVPMSETVAVTANGIAYGRKAFKFISSAVPTKAGGGVSTGTISVGTSDVFGFSMRSDKWEYMNCYWAGAFLTVSTGYLPADTTNPATSTTGDVRGTLQLSAVGQQGAYAAGGATNGARRLAVFQTLPSAALVAATPQNPAPLFGMAQA